MNSDLSSALLNQFKEYVEPVGEYCFPPEYATMRPGWRVENEERVNRYYLDVAKTLLELNEQEHYYNQPESVEIDLGNLRQYTIEHYTLFSKLIDQYKKQFDK